MMVTVDVEEPFYSEKHSRETDATKLLSPITSNKPVVCKILAEILLKCRIPTGIRFRMGRLTFECSSLKGSILWLSWYNGFCQSVSPADLLVEVEFN